MNVTIGQSLACYVGLTMLDIEIIAGLDAVSFHGHSMRAEYWMELIYGSTTVKYPIGDAGAIEEFSKNAERADMTVERTQ